jgi:hypothetical protein
MNNLILKDNNKVIIEINCQVFEVFEINNEFSLIPNFLFIMTKPSKDLSLVIGINDNRTIKFITVMETFRSKRVK